MKVIRSIVINRSAPELFEFWRKLENLPQFMTQLVSVTETGPGQSRWVAKGPGHTTFEWDAIIVNEHQNELIAWKSEPGAAFENAGSVRFEPAAGEPGTEVKVTLEYAPPGGQLGGLIAKLRGTDPEAQLDEALKRLKGLMETRR